MENIPVDKRNRLNDQYVKYLFANEENKELAISLINSVVEREGLETIKDLNFIGTELNSKNIDDKSFSFTIQYLEK